MRSVEIFFSVFPTCFIQRPLGFLWLQCLSQELSEAEAVLAKNDLKLALKRIEDLHQAINGEIDSDSDSDNRFQPVSMD
jgi:hypothetical protein